jgi:hypothetical protein
MEFADVAGALIDGPCAWLSEAELARALGSDGPAVAAAVEVLVAAGLLARWARPDGPVVTLSPLGAAQLGARLVETRGAEVYRWSTEAVSVRSRTISAAQRRRMHDHHALVEQIPDHRTAEPADRPSRPRLTIETAPRPRVILWGHCAWPWDEAGRRRRPATRCRVCSARKRRHARLACSACGFGLRARPVLDHCPACRGRKLAPVEYCLRCDRWGMDGYFRRRFGSKSVRPQRRKAG